MNNNEQLKTWLQDNIRIILSVLIIIAIVAGIYSYSKKEVQEETIPCILIELVDGKMRCYTK